MKVMERLMKGVLRGTAVVAAGPLLLLWATTAQAQSSASYEITRSVMSGGGGRSSSASYDLTGTLGQPSPVEVSESDGYNLGSGFWGATVKLFTVAIESISYSIAEGARITWHSIAGANYTLYFTDDLMDVWTALSSFTGTGSLMEWLDDGTETGTPPTAASILKRFYRLIGQP
ncbi:hypothetical protein HQ563_10030 [bacterium]|nr:hypothetical protein [bacterium]